MNWEGIDEVVAIADARSFVGAAALLGVSTSHVSRIVGRLESRLDTRLFHRTTRRVSLTDTGAAFVDRCRHLIDERDDLLAETAGAGEPQGDLRITCSTTLGERFVEPIVRRFAEAHPRLSVRLELTNTVVDLISEGFDIGIRTRHVVDDRLTGRRVASRSLIACAAPSYLEKAGVPRTVDDLLGHQCLIGSAATWHFVEKGVAKNITPRGRWRCNSGPAIVEAALSGMGICQLPEFYVRRDIAEQKLVSILDGARSAPEAVWAVFPKRRQLQPKVRNFVDVLVKELPQVLAPV